jgi:hypothetical protein
LNKTIITLEAYNIDVTALHRASKNGTLMIMNADGITAGPFIITSLEVEHDRYGQYGLDCRVQEIHEKGSGIVTSIHTNNLDDPDDLDDDEPFEEGEDVEEIVEEEEEIIL